MQSPVPKQFLLLGGKPVLMHSIEAFYRSELHPQIIVVLNAEYIAEWNQLCADYQFNIPHQICQGGDTRYQSVKNSLQLIDKNSITAIHDGARPLVPASVITESYRVAEEKGTAVAAVKSTDSLRQIKNNVSKVLDRDEVYRIQTPQTFRSELLIEAYKQPYQYSFSDDATVAEKAGNPIHLIEGAQGNIKITYPDDLPVAEQLLKRLNKKRPESGSL